MSQTVPIGLAAHEAVLARELRLLNLPPKPWLTPRPGVVDVVVVGAGLSGLCAAAALRFHGVGNVLLLDRAPAGQEGPWVTFARMRTLRTAKDLAGLALGIPALTPRAWFEAQHGEAAWDAMQRFPREMWMDYLIWYRKVLDMPVRNGASVTALRPCADGLLALDVETPAGAEAVLARRVILATGIDGLGGPFVPPIARGIDRRFWAHSSDAVDFASLAGKRVGVVGAGASAMDNAAIALEHGAAAVELLIRRKEMPRLDRLGGIGGRGTALGFFGLPQADRWEMFRLYNQAQLPPPRHSVLRVADFPQARFHLGSPILALREEAGALAVRTPRHDYTLDFLLFATGFAIDLSLRPEFSVLAPHIRSWADSYTPPPGHEDAALGASPDLGPSFELQEKVPGTCPALAHIHAFNYPAVLSHGKLTSGIPSVSVGAQTMAQGIVRSLYVEDRAQLQEKFAAFATPELRGDEWVDADAASTPIDALHV